MKEVNKPCTMSQYWDSIPEACFATRLQYISVRLQGADFKNNQTTKQVNNYIWTNRKRVKFCFYLPIGPNKNCLIVWLFGCF